MEEKNTNWCDELTTKTQEEIQKIIESDINIDNITYLSKLVDIHKDLKNEEYWKEKVKIMYGNYYGKDYYGRRMRDSHGRYMEDSYGRRGVPGTGRGRYRGHEMLNDMMDHYGNYSESKDMYSESGSYGAKEDSKQSLHKMLKSAEEFFEAIVAQADSPEEIQMVKDTAHRISEM